MVSYGRITETVVYIHKHLYNYVKDFGALMSLVS